MMLEAWPELLEGWCGPVVVRWKNGEPDPGCAFDGEILFEEDDGWGALAPWAAATIHLDLGRPECRDRVLRVLAARIGMPVPHLGCLLVWALEPEPETAEAVSGELPEEWLPVIEHIVGAYPVEERYQRLLIAVADVLQ